MDVMSFKLFSQESRVSRFVNFVNFADYVMDKSYVWKWTQMSTPESTCSTTTWTLCRKAAVIYKVGSASGWTTFYPLPFTWPNNGVQLMCLQVLRNPSGANDFRMRWTHSSGEGNSYRVNCPLPYKAYSNRNSLYKQVIVRLPSCPMDEVESFYKLCIVIWFYPYRTNNGDFATYGLFDEF